MNALLRSYMIVTPLLSVSMCLVALSVNVEKAIRIHGWTINIVQEEIVNNVLLSIATIEESVNIRIVKKSVCEYRQHTIHHILKLNIFSVQ